MKIFINKIICIVLSMESFTEQDYMAKYLKYKSKYNHALLLREQRGGGTIGSVNYLINLEKWLKTTDPDEKSKIENLLKDHKASDGTPLSTSEAMLKKINKARDDKIKELDQIAEQLRQPIPTSSRAKQIRNAISKAIAWSKLYKETYSGTTIDQYIKDMSQKQNILEEIRSRESPVPAPKLASEQVTQAPIPAPASPAPASPAPSPTASLAPLPATPTKTVNATGSHTPILRMVKQISPTDKILEDEIKQPIDKLKIPTRLQVPQVQPQLKDLDEVTLVDKIKPNQNSKQVEPAPNVTQFYIDKMDQLKELKPKPKEPKKPTEPRKSVPQPDKILEAFISPLDHTDHTKFVIKLNKEKITFMNTVGNLASLPETIPGNNPFLQACKKDTSLLDKMTAAKYLEKNYTQVVSLASKEANLKFLQYRGSNVTDPNLLRYYGMLTKLERDIFTRLEFRKSSDPFPSDFLKDDSDIIKSKRHFDTAIKIIKEDDKDFLTKEDWTSQLHKDYIKLDNLKQTIEKCDWVTNNIFKQWAFYLYILLFQCKCIDETGKVLVKTDNKKEQISFCELMKRRSKLFMKSMYCLEELFEDDKKTLIQNKRTNHHVVGYMYTLLINLQLNGGFEISTEGSQFANEFEQAVKNAPISDKYVFIETPDNVGTINTTENSKQIGIKNFSDTITTLPSKVIEKTTGSTDFEEKDIKFLVIHGDSTSMDMELDKKIANWITNQKIGQKMIVFADTNWTMKKKGKNLPDIRSQEELMRLFIKKISETVKWSRRENKQIDAYIGKYQIKKTRPKIGFANEQIYKTDLKPETDGMILMFINIDEKEYRIENIDDLIKL